MKKLAISSSIALALLAAQAPAVAAQDMGGMKGMPMEKMSPPANGKGAVHTAKGTVRKVDAKAAVVTLAHGPVKSLNWPAMSMGFKVRDKGLLEQLSEGRSVEFEFVQSGKDYVITGAK